MATAAEYRQALTSLQAIGPTLERLLKAGADAATLIDEREARVKALEANIRGLEEREQRALLATTQAREAVERTKTAANDEVAAINAAIDVRKADLAKSTEAATAKRREVAELDRRLKELQREEAETAARVNAARVRADQIEAALLALK